MMARAARFSRRRFRSWAHRYALRRRPRRAFLPEWTGLLILTEADFRSLRMDAPVAIWEQRSRHFDVITDDRRLTTIGEMIDHLSQPGRLDDLLVRIADTPMQVPFKEPVWSDDRFWSSGNNYFIYRIIYGFRKGVLPYSEANRYIREVRTPALYSRDYFEALGEMCDDEVEELLVKDPARVRNGALRHGRHRGLAMAGRLILGKPYIPIWAFME
jgi:hypothetical protein